MTSYAPLLAKDGFTQWNPDLIYFNNTEVKPTVGYEVQKMFGNNAGTQYIPAKVNVDNWREDVKKRFAISIVKEPQSGDLIVKMVNLLPESANVKLDLPVSDSSRATMSILTGNPADRKLTPTTSEVSLSKDSPVELKAYSLTILRMSGK